MRIAIRLYGDGFVPHPPRGPYDWERTSATASTPTTFRDSITVTGSSAGHRVMHPFPMKHRRLASHDIDATYHHPPLRRPEAGTEVHPDVADGAVAGCHHRSEERRGGKDFRSR